MRGVHSFGHIYLHREAVDLWKSIGGLSAIVANELELDVFSESSLFLFTNQRRHLLKALYWDKSGFALWMKRLEEERFKWPVKLSEGQVIEVTSEQLEWLLNGVDLSRVKTHRELKYENLL